MMTVKRSVFALMFFLLGHLGYGQTSQVVVPQPTCNAVKVATEGDTVTLPTGVVYWWGTASSWYGPLTSTTATTFIPSYLNLGDPDPGVVKELDVCFGVASTTILVQPANGSSLVTLVLPPMPPLIASAGVTVFQSGSGMMTFTWEKPLSISYCSSFVLLSCFSSYTIMDVTAPDAPVPFADQIPILSTTFVFMSLPQEGVHVYSLFMVGLDDKGNPTTSYPILTTVMIPQSGPSRFGVVAAP